MERPELSTINECWIMDFVADQLIDGRKFRVLTVVDNFSRKFIGIHPQQSIKRSCGVSVMEKIRMRKGALSQRIQLYGGSEFISRFLYNWVYDKEVIFDLYRPGKPTDNLCI
ncbi:MAG: DDE-type integrase/transposase/recombinase [Melioribacteraceae bacterium]|nr:DDE-type integrase/transposase/recombinase [Melioribacteraceae bacterium]